MPFGTRVYDDGESGPPPPPPPPRAPATSSPAPPPSSEGGGRGGGGGGGGGGSKSQPRKPAQQHAVQPTASHKPPAWLPQRRGELDFGRVPQPTRARPTGVLDPPSHRLLGTTAPATGASAGVRPRTQTPPNLGLRAQAGMRRLQTLRPSGLPSVRIAQKPIRDGDVTFTLKRSIDKGRFATVDVRLDPFALGGSVKVSGQPVETLQSGGVVPVTVPAGHRITAVYSQPSTGFHISPPESERDSDDDEPETVLLPGVPVLAVLDPHEKGKVLPPHFEYDVGPDFSSAHVTVRRARSGIGFLTNH